MRNNTIFVQLVQRSRRKAVILRGKQAEEYFAYYEEVGCDVWGVLCSIKEALNEPMGMYPPKKLIQTWDFELCPRGQSRWTIKNPYPRRVQFLDLEPCTYMVFQGEPYDDENFEGEIVTIRESIQRYHPESVGYRFDDTDAPMYQLEPRGERGYIEARPVLKI
ncbi:MAG: hypothetical protein U5L46_03280 [Agrobacterium sp.]|nr:hypothetical protein [Agrobacterium sp.]